MSSIRQLKEEDIPDISSILKNKKTNLSTKKQNLRFNSLDSLGSLNFKDQRSATKKEINRFKSGFNSPDMLNLIREEEPRSSAVHRKSAKHIRPRNKLEGPLGRDLHRSNLHLRELGRSKLADHRSSEVVSSTHSQTFSEIEKHYNHLIEKALDISISNKDFSKMSSLRTNHVNYAVGKFGSERTNTIFQNEFNVPAREGNNSGHHTQGLKCQISPNLG